MDEHIQAFGLCEHVLDCAECERVHIEGRRFESRRVWTVDVVTQTRVGIGRSDRLADAMGKAVSEALGGSGG